MDVKCVGTCVTFTAGRVEGDGDGRRFGALPGGRLGGQHRHHAGQAQLQRLRKGLRALLLVALESTRHAAGCRLRSTPGESNLRGMCLATASTFFPRPLTRHCCYTSSEHDR